MTDNLTKHILDVILNEARAGDEAVTAWLRSTPGRELCVQAGVAHALLVQSLDDEGETVTLAESDWRTIADRYALGG